MSIETKPKKPFLMNLSDKLNNTREYIFAALEAIGSAPLLGSDPVVADSKQLTELPENLNRQQTQVIFDAGACVACGAGGSGWCEYCGRGRPKN